MQKLESSDIIFASTNETITNNIVRNKAYRSQIR